MRSRRQTRRGQRRLTGVGVSARPGALTARAARGITAAVTTLALFCACAPSLAADEAVETKVPGAGAEITSQVYSASATTSGRYDGLARVIDSLLAKPHMRGARLGLIVESLGTGEVLFERDADVPMTPASNMKVVTGAAALALLGPDYRFETVVAARSPVTGGVIEGDLYVVGTGDPSLVSEQLWKLVEAIRVRGIRRVAGDLILDASHFDNETVASPDVANGQRAYHARTGALSLNFNSIAVYVSPGDRAGDPARVALAPETGFVEIRNQATTCTSRRSSTLAAKRTYENGRNVVTVSGRHPADAGTKAFYRNLEDPVLHFGTLLSEFLADQGIAVDGLVRAGEAPEDAQVLYVHESKPLSLIVRDLNKFSNNFVAEQLLKSMGATMFGPPGTTAVGARAVGAFLQGAGVDSAAYRVIDGSGFSRDNRLTPRAIVKVLRRALSDFRIRYEYAASLSVSGIDGTLSGRMGYAGLEGAVRAKTGLLDGVTAISGVARTLAGEDVLFSIIVNGFSCEAWRVHDAEHAILTSIAGTDGPPGAR